MPSHTGPSATSPRPTGPPVVDPPSLSGPAPRAETPPGPGEGRGLHKKEILSELRGQGGSREKACVFALVGSAPPGRATGPAICGP
eukprot:scaffold1388_cov390-Prasinococcus_capsulatus_cf.AAC.6